METRRNSRGDVLGPSVNDGRSNDDRQLVTRPPLRSTPLVRTIVADPPWQYRDRVGPGLGVGVDRVRGRRGAAGHYAVLSVPAICDLGRAGTIAGYQAAADAHLYVWATNAFVDAAHVVARSWGFEPRTILTWIKPSIGMGHYFRNSTEHVVFAVRGRLPLRVKDQRTDFTAPRRRHSQKPDAFVAIVERCSPGPYLELFARTARPGWIAWGLEAPDAERSA